MNDQAWTIDAEARSSGIRVEIVHCDWPRPSEYLEQSHWHALNLSLTDIPADIDGYLKCGSTIGECHGVGRLVFVPAHSNLGCRGSGGRHQQAVRAFLDPTCMATRLPPLDDFQPESLRRCLDIQAPDIVNTMIRVYRETLQPDFGTGILLESLGAVMAVELERLLLPTAARVVATTQRNLLTRENLLRIVDYVNSRNSVSITITEVAEACNISSRSLTRKFKQTTGETLHEYAHRRATTRARALLRDPARSIKEVSYELGFLSPSAFSIAFRRATGLSPSGYRRAVA